ncbi:acyltransferase family protein [soil metagenome]
MTQAVTRPLEWSPPRQAISRVPYLPGLDGMRALAVVAVMLYHANPSWLPGGFLGVEVFFVISGYLITLLLIGEHERTGRVSLGQFWLRRARRLLPALFTLLIGLTIYAVFFRRDVLGQLRGDVLAGLTYVSNWYQIWVGQGYTQRGDFAPLRHLWSLAVEEQFYLVWPLVMVGLMRLGRRRLPELSRWLVLAAIVVTLALAVLYHPGRIGSCQVTPGAYWDVGGRCVSKTDALYLGTFTRFGGLLLGSAFAMVWRPVAIMRGPMRTKGHVLDLVAILGLAGLGALCWYLHLVTPGGADPWLFRGGFLLTGLATLAVMAAVTHARSWAGPAIGNPLFLWIGTRSYGMYLYHWPIYQVIRRVAGNGLTVSQFAVAMVATAIVTETSYRFIETPIRTGRIRRWWRRLQAKRDPNPRRMIATVGAGVVAVSMFAAANLATAELKPNEIEESIRQGEQVGKDPLATVIVTPDTAEPPPVNATTPIAPTPASIVTPSTDPGANGGPRPVETRPPRSDPSTTTTTEKPRPVARVLAIGDSVMLGARDELEARGITVSAEQNRQMIEMVPVVQQLQADEQFGRVVVVHLGTNGPFSGETLDAFMNALSGVRRVVVLTLHVPPTADAAQWVPGNNRQLFGLPNRYDNVELLYWDGLATACDCLYDDGIHLNQAGQDYYTQLVADLLDL